MVLLRSRIVTISCLRHDNTEGEVYALEKNEIYARMANIVLLRLSVCGSLTRNVKFLREYGISDLSLVVMNLITLKKI